MTKIAAQVVGDSSNEHGDRLTTMVATLPRIILAEFNTHRAFSRNSASSRAIPFEKMVRSVEENPFVPIAWQKDHKGMQGTEYWEGKGAEFICRTHWLRVRDNAVTEAKILNGQGLTKQLCNRLLEPFMWHTVIVSATDWENFFALRCPRYSLFHENVPLEFRSKRDLLAHVHRVEAPEFREQYDHLTPLEWLRCNKGHAEIHMMALAEAMWDAYNESKPKRLKAGEWHIPFEWELLDQGREEEFLSLPYSEADGDAMVFYQMCKVKLATVMAARTSYTVVGDDLKPLSYPKMLELHDRMATADPLHASPFEHCARANEGRPSRNFRGFTQYRELLETR